MLLWILFVSLVIVLVVLCVCIIQTVGENQEHANNVAIANMMAENTSLSPDGEELAKREARYCLEEFFYGKGVQKVVFTTTEGNGTIIRVDKYGEFSLRSQDYHAFIRIGYNNITDGSKAVAMHQSIINWIEKGMEKIDKQIPDMETHKIDIPSLEKQIRKAAKKAGISIGEIYGATAFETTARKANVTLKDI